MLTKETWNTSTTICNIFHENTAFWLLFCPPTKVYFCDYEMSIVQYLWLWDEYRSAFFRFSVNSEFGNKKKVEF